MSSPVEEWIEKAEEDFHVALSLRRSRRYPAHNAVCFHAQQCVEKYLKEDAKTAVAIMKRARADLRQVVGLSKASRA